MPKPNTFEARLRRLEDIEEIRRLKSLYCHFANVGEGSGDIDKFVALFTEDAVWDLSGNVRTGRASIAERLREVEKLQYVGLHFGLNPRIEVDGDEAHGLWDLNFPVIPPGEKQPRVVCGFYEDRLLRTPDGWRFTYVKYRVSPRFSLS
jgi:hypothetical protein